MISVLIPVFNDKDNIVDAIKSVMNQTYKDFEIIIIDDCSNDETMKMVLKYLSDNHAKIGRNRFKMVKTKFHSGFYATLNEGINTSKGEFVTFLRSTDTFAPKKLEIQMENMNKKRFCVGNIGLSGRIDTRLRITDLTLLFRKCIIDRIGYFDAVKTVGIAEFIDRIIRVYGDNSVYHINEPLYNEALTDDPYLKVDMEALSEYKESYVKWHSQYKKDDKNDKGIGSQLLRSLSEPLFKRGISSLYMPHPLTKRPFPIPDGI